jgi:hypothetical protein
VDSPITARLEPDDDVVIVMQEAFALRSPGVPTRKDAVEELRGYSKGGAIVIDVETVTAAFIEGGRWVETDFQGSIVDVVLPGLPGATPGSTVRFHYLWGGDIIAGGVLVRAMVGRPLGVIAGKRYFMFVNDLEPNMPGKVFEVKADGTLINPAVPESKGSLAEPFDVLVGLTVAQVRALLSSHI